MTRSPDTPGEQGGSDHGARPDAPNAEGNRDQQARYGSLKQNVITHWRVQER